MRQHVRFDPCSSCTSGAPILSRAPKINEVESLVLFLGDLSPKRMERSQSRLSPTKGATVYPEAIGASEAHLRTERTTLAVLSSNGMKTSLHPVGSRASQAFHPVGRLCRVTALTTPIREIVQCFAPQITPFGHISLVLCISPLSTGGPKRMRTGYQVTHNIASD